MPRLARYEVDPRTSLSLPNLLGYPPYSEICLIVPNSYYYLPKIQQFLLRGEIKRIESQTDDLDNIQQLLLVLRNRYIDVGTRSTYFHIKEAPACTDLSSRSPVTAVLLCHILGGRSGRQRGFDSLGEHLFVTKMRVVIPSLK